jgi:hypothetical protein
MKNFTFFAQVWLSFFDSGDDHIANAGGRQSVQTSAKTLDGNYVQVLGTSVVCAVDDGADGQAERNSEFTTTNTSSTFIFKLI